MKVRDIRAENAELRATISRVEALLMVRSDHQVVAASSQGWAVPVDALRAALDGGGSDGR